MRAPAFDSVIEGLAGAAAVLGDSRLTQLVAALQDHRRTAQLQILVVGITGSGRASTINAMLRRPNLLPVSLTPKAPISITLGYGPVSTVEVEGVDGSRVAVPPQDLGDLLRDPATAERFRCVDVRAADEQLGTCDFRIEALERERDDRDWLEALAVADFTLVILDATALLSQREREFLRDTVARGGFHRMALVVNRIDLVPEDERAEIGRFLRSFLGPYESQPAIVETAAVAFDGDGEHPLHALFDDIRSQAADLKSAAMREALGAALSEIEDAATAERALAGIESGRVGEERAELDRRRDWLEGRSGRLQQRAATFIGTVPRERLLSEIARFGAVVQERLPAEIGEVGDLQVSRQYLPGYIEAIWRQFLDHRMTAVRDQLAEEAESVEAQIRADLTELVDAVDRKLGAGVEAFGGDSRLRAFVMPRRGQSNASKVARGLGLHAFVMLTISTIFLGFSPVPGLLALGASHVIRRVFTKDIERADREALVEAAGGAARDAGIALRSEVGTQFERLITNVQREIGDQYAGAFERIAALLGERARQSEGIAERRQRLATLVEETIPDLWRQVEALDGGGA